MEAHSPPMRWISEVLGDGSALPDQRDFWRALTAAREAGLVVRSEKDSSAWFFLSKVLATLWRLEPILPAGSPAAARELELVGHYRRSLIALAGAVLTPEGS